MDIILKTPGRYLPAGGQHLIATHRIVRIDIDRHTGERIITTKGDANPQSYKFIDYPINKANYIGKVIFVIPKVGILFVGNFPDGTVALAIKKGRMTHRCINTCKGKKYDFC